MGDFHYQQNPDLRVVRLGGWAKTVGQRQPASSPCSFFLLAPEPDSLSQGEWH